jgi:hypothetical protein
MDRGDRFAAARHAAHNDLAMRWGLHYLLLEWAQAVLDRASRLWSAGGHDIC